MPGMNDRFVSNGLSLACHIAQPSGPLEAGPAVVLCHGFPIASLDAQRAGGTFPQLMDRTANELGCVAMTFNFRGCGESEGDFSLQGWVDDLRNAISHLLTLHEPTGVILLGTNTGGSIAICVAADDPRVSAAGLVEPPCRLRRLGRSSSAVPRPRPRHRGDPPSRLPAVGGGVDPRVPSLPPGGVGSPLRASAPAGDARRRGRQRAGVRRPPVGQRPRQRRAEPVRGGGPPVASRPACGGGAARLARPDAFEPGASERRAGLTVPSWSLAIRVAAGALRFAVGCTSAAFRPRTSMVRQGPDACRWSIRRIPGIRSVSTLRPPPSARHRVPGGRRHPNANQGAFMRKIALLITNQYQIHHYQSIARHLGPVTFVIEIRGSRLRGRRSLRSPSCT